MCGICAKVGLMLFDTDVLIWVLKGNPKAIGALESIEEPKASIVTAMELIQGARDRAELKSLREFLLTLQIVPLSENVGHRARVYMEEYALQSGLTMADALIGATAAENNVKLCTGNRKHFKAITEVDVQGFRP